MLCCSAVEAPEKERKKDELFSCIGEIHTDFGPIELGLLLLLYKKAIGPKDE